jgi:hypothetical protein
MMISLSLFKREIRESSRRTIVKNLFVFTVEMK